MAYVAHGLFFCGRVEQIFASKGVSAQKPICPVQRDDWAAEIPRLSDPMDRTMTSKKIRNRRKIAGQLQLRISVRSESAEKQLVSHMVRPRPVTPDRATPDTPQKKMRTQSSTCPSPPFDRALKSFEVIDRHLLNEKRDVAWQEVRVGAGQPGLGLEPWVRSASRLGTPWTTSLDAKHSKSSSSYHLLRTFASALCMHVAGQPIIRQ